jgi:hypothetical protein
MINLSLKQVGQVIEDHIFQNAVSTTSSFHYSVMSGQGDFEQGKCESYGDGSVVSAINVTALTWYRSHGSPLVFSAN